MFALFLLPLVSALSLPHDHDHTVSKRLGTTWYHDEAHPVHNLFRRAADDGNSYATVGSQQWSSGFPSVASDTITTPDSKLLPAAWVSALNAAVDAGKIPNIPPSSGPRGSVPVYPQGFDPNGDVVCSATYKTCQNPDDFWDGPSGTFGTGFDDGPTEFTPDLLNFLAANQEQATHFVIGTQILYYPQNFQKIFDSGNDIAVHTWTHPLMTTLSNLDVLSEIGWTMQLIHNSTGGRIPKFWRPPYGDSDNRVRAIAKEVFGLETIIWNQDTEDWTMADPTNKAVTPESIMAQMTTWTSQPKTTGLIVLEHETSQKSVDVFKTILPLVKSKGWKTASVATLLDGPTGWANAQSSTGSVTPAGILAQADTGKSSNTTSNQTLATTAPSSTTSGSTPKQSSTSQQSQTSSNTQKPGSSASRRTLAVPTIFFGFFGLLACLLW